MKFVVVEYPNYATEINCKRYEHTFESYEEASNYLNSEAKGYAYIEERG